LGPVGGRVDDLHHLIERAYAAALDPNQWKSWTADVVSALGGAGGTLSVLDTTTGQLRTLLPVGWERFEDEYNAHWHKYDPLIPAVLAPKTIKAFVDTDHLDETRRDVAEYMAWQRGVPKFHHHAAAALPLGGGSFRGGLSIHRRNEDGYTPPEELAKLNALLPHLAAAFVLGFHHAEALLDSFWRGIHARRGGEAILLLDENGHVLRKTQGADSILAIGDGLTCIHGRLHASYPAGDDLLQRAIGRGLLPQPQSAAIRIHRPSGRSSYILSLYPLIRAARMLAPAEAAILVSISDPAAATAADLDLYQEAFGLTSKEIRLCQLLLEGHSPESAARVMQVQMPTVRTHLQSIFRKTETSGQADLMRQLHRIG